MPRDGARGAGALLPQAPGVYRFRDAQRRVLYIGRAADLHRRVGSYWADASDRRHLGRMVARIASVEAVACDSEHEAAWLERNLLERGRPRWNRIEGTESPVFIRLDPRPGSPGLSVVHLTEVSVRARHFGPYLGGSRVRLVVSALNRVMPLTYAGDGLSGFGRDMARALGVGPEDRTALVGAVTAVLDREPAALASLGRALARRRDAAARGLAFELAARLQAEIEAVEWVLAEQKAALPEPDDFEVHGWAAGVLVGFEVRAGRLGGWKQRACEEAPASRRVAATPPRWTAFARRNAELAARLLGR